MGVPLNHPFIDGFSRINHPFWGTPIYGTPHLGNNMKHLLAEIHGQKMETYPFKGPVSKVPVAALFRGCKRIHPSTVDGLKSIDLLLWAGRLGPIELAVVA